MRRYVTLTAMMACLFALGAGCGNSSSGTDMMSSRDMRVFIRDMACVPPDLATSGDLATPMTTDVACGSYASSYCSRLQTCYPFAFNTTYQDSMQCQQRIKIVCNMSAQLTGTSQSAANITACSTALMSASCPDFLTGFNLYPTQCRTAGTLANGAACGEDHQCSSAYCKQTAGSNCGMCAAKVSTGVTCSADADCAFGLVCSGQGTDRKCATPVNMGGACNVTDKPCKSGLLCLGGTCGKGQSAGTTCTLGTPSCDDLNGLYCDTNTGKCVATGIAQVNQACGFINSSKVQCAGGSDCFAVGAGRKCVAAASDGGSCTSGATTSGPGCLAQARCLPGLSCATTCQVPNLITCR